LGGARADHIIVAQRIAVPHSPREVQREGFDSAMGMAVKPDGLGLGSGSHEHVVAQKHRVQKNQSLAADGPPNRDALGLVGFVRRQGEGERAIGHVSGIYLKNVKPGATSGANSFG
jgi:hypothetical protein